MVESLRAVQAAAECLERDVHASHDSIICHAMGLHGRKRHGIIMPMQKEPPKIRDVSMQNTIFNRIFWVWDYNINSDKKAGSEKIPLFFIFILAI